MKCITWCGTQHGCLAVKIDSCNNLLSSVHTLSVIILHLWQFENKTRKFINIIIIINSNAIYGILRYNRILHCSHFRTSRVVLCMGWLLIWLISEDWATVPCAATRWVSWPIGSNHAMTNPIQPCPDQSGPTMSQKQCHRSSAFSVGMRGKAVPMPFLPRLCLLVYFSVFFMDMQ